MNVGIGSQGGDLRDEFMTLLVAQLRNQDPLQPVQQQDFISQLAQFSTLESIENLGGSFDNLLQLQQLSYGSDLVGKNVVYDSETGQQSGIVNAVFPQGDSILLDVDGTLVNIDNLLGVGGG
ncbi:MAG: flagellar hook capping protein [Planctomycetales bacterium]|nr:flagellar hook capping protein [Planctomycetales bacterium]